ncbi:MAG: hypothetical protein ACYSTT_24295 [Planctomycetota bacterium]|jgi:hypothetical protein
MAKKKRTIVGSPITPSMLVELDAITKLSPTPVNFNPTGNWINTYRIWTCHGYRESGNDNVGFLRIERIGSSAKTFMLNVHQEVVQTDALINIIDGTIKCRNNQLASPVEWELQSRFIDADGKNIPKLLSNNNGKTAKRTERATSDFCLFEAIQRLAYEKNISLSFDLLEGMSLKKQGHKISYRGVTPLKMDEVDIPLHCFVQAGSGILPYEYWLDDRHRLLAVISMNKAYILDEQAEQIAKREVKEARESYQRKRK